MNPSSGRSAASQASRTSPSEWLDGRSVPDETHQGLSPDDERSRCQAAESENREHEHCVAHGRECLADEHVAPVTGSCEECLPGSVAVLAREHVAGNETGEHREAP